METTINPLRLKLSENNRIEISKDNEFKTLLIIDKKFVPIDDLKDYSNYNVIRKFKSGALIINKSYYQEDIFYIIVKYFLSKNGKEFEKIMKEGCQIKIFTK